MSLKRGDWRPIKRPYGTPPFLAMDPAINRRATFGHSYGMILTGKIKEKASR
jgi:hypothetical protein